MAAAETGAERLRAVVPDSSFTIRVPGSIANLGPGFDTFAVAVQLYLELRVTILPGAGALEFVFASGEFGGDNSIARAFHHAVRLRGLVMPSMRVEVTSEIPIRAGLGSSAAATVAGLRLFEAVAGPLDRDELLTAAHLLEGHPDNTSACLLGGLTLSVERGDGRITAESMAWPSAVHMLVLTPEVPLPTREARAALPSIVPFGDAVRNLQRAALLQWSLREGRTEHLREALRDVLHQPYRAPLVPGMADLLALEHPELFGVCLSGAGPSLLALCSGRSMGAERLIAETYGRTGIPFRLRWLLPHPGGEPAAPDTLADIERRTT